MDMTTRLSHRLNKKQLFNQAVEEAGVPTKPGQLFKSALGLWIKSFTYDTYVDPYTGCVENIIMWKENDI